MIVNRPCCLQLGLHPIFRRFGALKDHKLVNRGREMAEVWRDRWETSDSPMVHRLQVSC